MIWFFDGSKDAFLTTFLLAYRDEHPIVSAGSHQLSLGQECVFVRADENKARRCEARLKELDKNCMRDLDLLLRSGESDAPRIAFEYFRLIAERGRPVRGMLAEDAVAKATECIRRVTFEVHRFKGFVRFLESASGALYAPISPDHDIADLLVPHFRGRIPDIPFVIHDVRRGKAAVWDGAHAFLAPLEEAEIVLSADETAWQALWKQYYRSVNIPSRERIRQMKGYMPVRYWKFMPEDPASAADRTARGASVQKSPDAAPRPPESPRSPHGSPRP